MKIYKATFGHFRSLISVLVGLPILGIGITSAQAQGGALLEEVIVTAQKREQSVQDVPLAVTVLGAEQIDSAYAVGFEDLQKLIPSVSFTKGSTNRNSAVVVRGIGTISFSTAAEPSVSTVVDGVVLGRSGQAFTDLYDLERLEVLRGPQGTLFGKNASAGVVNLTTRRPSEQLEGSIDVSVFEDDEQRVKGRVSGPLSENVRASLTGFVGNFDGYINNVFDGDTVQGYDRTGFRGMLEWDVNENVEVLFIAEDYSADDDCCIDLEVLPSGRNPASASVPNSLGVVNGVPDFDLDQRQTDSDFTTQTLDDTTAFSVQVEAGIGAYTLTSITAFREWDNTEIREGDFTSIAGDSNLPVFGVPFQLHDVGIQTWQQFSQEVRIASPSDQAITWQAGVFYWDLDSDRSFTRDASCQNNAGQLSASIENHLRVTLGDSTTSVDDFITANAITCNANDIVAATAVFDTEFQNISAFGQGEAKLSDALTLIFGARLTDDEVSFNHVRLNSDVFGRQGVGVRAAFDNTDFSNETSETNFSIKTGLQWNVNDTGLLYATFSQGYKGPAFNVFFNQGINDTLPIGPEESDAYEIGYKLTTGNLFANVAIFRTDIEGFQANNFDTSTGTTITRLTNAGDVSTQGLEFDFTWQPLENLQLSGGFAVIDAEIDSFNCPIGESCTDRSGLDVPFSPDLKYTLSANYIMPFSNMDVILNASFVHTDEQTSGLPDNNGNQNPITVLPEYDILNASVAFSFADDKYRVTLIGKNLGDESFLTTGGADGFRYQIPRDAERYFGVAFKANF